MDQILIRVLGIIYSFIALPAMAIIAIAYFSKHRSKGGLYFLVGAVAMAIGSMFNQLFPFRIFVEQSTGSLSPIGKALTSTALIIHLVGFLIMVFAWGLITFMKKKRTV